jgi:hypothetical protein
MPEELPATESIQAIESKQRKQLLKSGAKKKKPKR